MRGHVDNFNKLCMTHGLFTMPMHPGALWLLKSNPHLPGDPLTFTDPIERVLMQVHDAEA